MSKFFSQADLYKVIRENDISGLERGILFLGTCIHTLPVCYHDHVAIEYAARLGHLQQVRLLLRDAERYQHKSWITDHIKDVFHYAVSHRKQDPQFLAELIHKYSDIIFYNPSEPIRNLVTENAFQLLDTLATKNHMYLQEIVDACFELGKRQVFDLRDEIKENHVFKEIVDRWKARDPLLFAVINNDIDQVSGLLPTFQNILWPEYWTRLVDIVIRKDDPSLFNVVVNATSLPHILRTTEIAEGVFVSNMLKTGLHHQSLNVVHDIISNVWLHKSHVQWTKLYFNSLLKGKTESAKTVDGFRGPADKDEIEDIIEKVVMFTWEEHADDLCAAVDGLFAAIRTVPDHTELLEHFTQAVHQYPMVKGRPDLVNAFHKYGIDYTEAEVIKSFDKSTKTNFYGMECQELAQLNSWYMHIGDDARTIQVGYLHNDFIRHAFLSGNYDTVEIVDEDPLIEDQVDLLTRCVTGTGIRAIDSAHEDSEPLFEDIERRRRACLSLKKLCRLAIRGRVSRSRYEEGLLSLYVDEHLPRVLVLYLLFRDQNLHTPLYYSFQWQE